MGLTKAYIKKSGATLDSENACIFFGNYKSASTSVNRSVLKNRALRVKFDEPGFDKKLESYSMNDIEKIFKFTIVRNPWNRIGSAFVYLKRLGFIPKSTNFEKFVEEIILNLDRDKMLYPTYKQRIEAHVSFQHPRAFIDGEQFVDRIFKLEEINNHWNEIALSLNLKTSFPHKNKTKGNDYSRLYTKRTRKLVSKLYKIDIELFNY